MTNNSAGRPLFDRRRWIVLLVVAVAAGIALLAGLLFYQGTAASAAGFIPISMQSLQRADYSAGQREAFFAPVEIELIEDTLRDSEPELPASEVEQRVQEVLNELETPVPTVTPFGTTSSAAAQQTTAGPLTSTLPPTDGPSPTAGPSPTGTGTPTGGPSPTETNTATAGPSPTQTNTATAVHSPTAGPSLTATATSSPIPSQPATPTVTPSPSATQTPIPSATVTASPTVTLTPTSTATHTPTSSPTFTPVPSDTPSGNSCVGLSTSSVSVNGTNVMWSVSNSNSSAAAYSRILISWPNVNGELRQLKQGNPAIWTGQEQPTSITITSFSLPGGSIDAQSAPTFQLKFENAAASTGYSMTISFDSGCQLAASG